MLNSHLSSITHKAVDFADWAGVGEWNGIGRIPMQECYKITIRFPHCSCSFSGVKDCILLCLRSLRSPEILHFFSFYILLSFTVALRIAWSPHTDIIDSLHPEFNYKETSDKSKYHSSCLKYTWYPRMMLVDIFQNKEPV